MEKVVFYDWEEIWPDNSITCPKFTSIQSLELYATCLCVSKPARLKPFLDKSLKELKIWTNDGDSEETPMLGRRGSEWLIHAGITCINLTVLKLEVTLNVSSAELAQFFRAMPQLETVRLGAEMNWVLDDDSVVDLLRVPSLQDLSMNFELTTSLVNEFVGLSGVREILPKIVKLAVTFADGNDLGPTLLLSAAKTVKNLSMTLRSTIRGQVMPIHPSFFSIMGSLSELEHLSLHLDPNIRLTCPDLQAIISHPASMYLTNSMFLSDYPQLPAKIALTGRDLATTPLTAEFLELLDDFELTSPIPATYDESILVIHTVMNISQHHTDLFVFDIDESSSFGWPSSDDYAASQKEDQIWLGSLKSFAPDPVGWIARDLKTHINKAGKVIPEHELATNGQYNHLG